MTVLRRAGAGPMARRNEIRDAPPSHIPPPAFDLVPIISGHPPTRPGSYSGSASGSTLSPEFRSM